MKILIAADSFKDALNSFSVCSAIERGLDMANPDFHITSFPLADSGEGTSDILFYHLGGRKQTLTVNDPLFRHVNVDYLVAEDGKTAFIEMAKSAGLQLLTPAERNPMHTSTYGLGEMIRHAIDQGVENIILAIGGSATNDGGMGMAAALGFQFIDIHGRLLKGSGSDLNKIETITVSDELKSSLGKIKFSVICDVKNPLLGPRGAAFTYGKQKGADEDMLKILDDGLKHLAIKSNKLNLASIEGTGAAGGLGFGAMAFLDARLRRGIDLIIQLTDFETKVKNCDLIITGEGKIDNQTNQGKLIHGITGVASKYNIPVIALCGTLEATPANIKDLGLNAAFSITPKPCRLSLALSETAKNLETTAYNIGKLLNG